MFSPGHLYRENSLAADNLPVFHLDLYYEVRRDPQEGPMLYFRMLGDVDGTAFEETFSLHRDLAYNFASLITRVAARHGLPPAHGPILAGHKEYDLMFADIHDKLALHAGEPVDLAHLESDGL